MLVTTQTNMVNLFHSIEISVYYLEFSFSRFREELLCKDHYAEF
jgi:hypothetical protein